MVDFVKLIMGADTTGLLKGKDALDQVTAAGGRAEGRVRGVDGRFLATGRSATVMGGQTRKAAQDFDVLGSSVLRAAKNLGLMVAGSAVVMQLNKMTSTYTNSGNALRVLGLDAGQTTAKLRELGQMAKDTRTPFEATVKLYQRATMAGKDLGASQAQIMQFTKNVGLAMAQQGGSAASAAGALTQLSQAIGGTNIQAEEFNSLLDGAYPLVQAAARGIDEAGGSVGRLRALVVDGKISSKEFFDAILSQTGSLEAAFASTIPTVSQAFGVLWDQMAIFVGETDAALGVTSSLAQVMLFLADNVDRVAVYAATAAVAYGTVWVGTMVASRVATLGFVGSLAALRTALIRTGIGAAIVIAGELIHQLMQTTKAAGGFGKALSLLGNVAKAVWQGMVDSAAAIPVGLEGVWDAMRGGFMISLSRMTSDFQDFIWGIANAFNSAGFEEAAGSLMEVWDGADKVGLAMHKAGAAAKDGAAAKFAEAGGIISEAFGPVREAVDALNGTVTETTDTVDDFTGGVTNAGNAAGGAGEKAGKAAKKLDELKKAAEGWKDKLRTPVENYAKEVAGLNELMQAGLLTTSEYQKAIEMLNGELADNVPMVGEVSDAFGEFVAGGLKDFKGFVSSVLDSFKGMIAQMVATAAKNRIIIGLGLGGGGGVAGAAAGAVPGGAPAGGVGQSLGLLGQIGSVGSAFLSGAALSGSAFMSGGFGSMFSAIGAQVGTAVSTGSLTAIAASAGAILAPLAAVAAVFSFFSSKTKLLDAGLKVTVENLDTLVYTFKKVEKSKFWGLSKSTSTSWDQAASDLSNPIVKAISDIQNNVLDAAKQLGVGSKAFRDFSASIEFSTKDLSDDEIAQKLTEKLAELGDSFAKLAFGDLSYLIKEGESATTALQRLIEAMGSVNGMMDTLGNSFRATSLLTAGMASDLADMFGGLSEMATATSNYYKTFYTEEERLKTTTRQTSAVLKELGIAMPKTRDEYRNMVDALDLTTDAGRKAFAALVGMSSAFDEVLPKVGSFTKRISNMVASLTTRIDLMIGDLSLMQEKSLDAARNWRATSKTLRDFVTKMQSTAGALIDPKSAQANAERNYQDLLARALAGDAVAASELTAAADSLIANARGNAANATELARVEARVMSDFAKLAGVADVEAQRHEVVAGLLGDQVEVLEQIKELINSGLPLDPKELKKLTDKLGALSQQTTAVMGESFRGPMVELSKEFKALPMIPLRDSLEKLRQAVIKETERSQTDKAKQAAIDKAQANLSRIAQDQQKALERVKNAVGAVNTFDSNTGGALVDKAGNEVQAYVNAEGKAVLNATGVKGAAGKDLDLWKQTFWKDGGLEDQMYNANKAVADANKALEDARKAVRQAGGIPAFAAGGFHSGGARLVGEHGPEVEVTGPAKIYSASQTAAMLNSGGSDRQFMKLVEKMDELKEEVVQLRDENTQLQKQIVVSSSRTARTLVEWDRAGLPQERV